MTISKALSPAVVTGNGPLTYTFTIRNTGNTALTGQEGAVITDTFDPILNITGVTFNGTAWTSPEDYTYDAATGAFATVAGKLTVPEATFTQNADGSWTVTPGQSVLTVTGTVYRRGRNRADRKTQEHLRGVERIQGKTYSRSDGIKQAAHP